MRGRLKPRPVSVLLPGVVAMPGASGVSARAECRMDPRDMVFLKVEKP